MLGEYWHQYDRILWHVPRAHPTPEEAEAAATELFQWCRYLGSEEIGRYLVGIDCSYVQDPNEEWIKIFHERFAELNRSFAGYVFVSPNPWLRAMIRAMGLRLEHGDWHTFRNRDEAERWLTSRVAVA